MDNFTPEMEEKLVLLLDNALPEAEALALRRQLESAPGLKAAYQQLEVARNAVQYYGLHRQVASWHKDMMAEMQPPVRTIQPRNRIFRFVAGIAAAAVLITAVFLLTNRPADDAASLYAAAYQPYALQAMRDAAGSTGELEKAYTDKDYTAVRTLFTASRPDSNTRALLLNGMAALELDDPQTAIESLGRITILNNSRVKKEYQDETDFYLALAYLKNNQPDQCLVLLEKINKDPGHPYHPKVTAGLLQKVRKLVR